MKLTLFSSISLFLAVGSMAMTGCIKENPGNNNNNNNNSVNADPVEVLKDGSGYTQIYNDVMMLSSATSAPPSMGMLDYTLESNGNLNMAYYSNTPTQQDAMRINKRVTKNLNSGEMMPLPTGADKLDYSTTSIAQNGRKLVIEMYRPYTNFFTYATMSNGSSSGRIYCEFKGDINMSVSSFNPIGYPDFGYRFPCMNIYSRPKDNAFGYFAVGVKTPTYILSGTNTKEFTFYNKYHSIYASFLESDIFTYNKLKAIFVTGDSVLAYNVYPDSSKLEFITGISISGMSASQSTPVTVRHYTPDGQTAGFLIQNSANGHVWTFSYNFNTSTLTKGLNDATLDYSGSGTDYDVDEFGNVYYTGYAGNGANMNGVSVYKKETNGNVSLVGADDFLKFGQVIKLKTLSGKVFLTVTGKKTNSSYYQISMLKQN